MNSHFAAVAAGDRAPTAASPAGTGRTLLTLVRREFWEHRALWIAPLAVAVLLALCAIPAHVNVDLSDPNGGLGRFFDQQKVALFTIVQWALSVPLYIVMLIVLSFYLLDCLYAERKDRSILFWKSLPVSDGLTVASKLLVALVIVPLLVFALALVAHLVFSVIWAARVALGNAPAVLSWDTLAWAKLEIAMLLGLVLAVLWYAPFAAYLLLVSAWARRNAFLWAALPPVLAPLLERLAFGTHFLGQLIRYRFNGIWQTLALGHPIISHHVRLHSLGALLGELNFRAAFTDIDLWLGVAVTAALVVAAARIRRYRDDT
jgi:ABC-2 type transport system permease protein